MDEHFDLFLSEFPPLASRTVPDASVLDQYRNALPERLLAYWAAYGWRGFDHGRFWTTNPKEYEVVLEMWCGDSGFDIDMLQVFGRTAFGELYVWSNSHGKALTIRPLDQTVFTYPQNRHVAKGDVDRAIASVFSGFDAESMDYEDIDGKPLFKRALKRLGTLNENEMYAFEPALVLGGEAKIDNLVKVSIIEHLCLLAQLGEVEVVNIDTRRHGIL